jgi:hypothetical protein
MAVDNLEKLLYHTRKYINPIDVIQLERDIFYLKLLRKISLKEATGGGP